MTSASSSAYRTKKGAGLYSAIWVGFFIFFTISFTNAGELHTAAQKGDLEKVKSLITDDTKIDEKDQQGATPLLMAAVYGKADVVRYLISKGADVNARLANGTTPLMLASRYNESEVVSVLLDEGADVNAKEDLGYTALQCAIMEDNAKITELLLNKGADVNSALKDERTPIFNAAMRGHEAIVTLLLKNGANPNIYKKNTKSVPKSPLLIAAWNKSIDHNRYGTVIKALKENGAKDGWLSSVPGFNPEDFSQLTLSMSKDKTIMVGSMPFILGQHYAARPSKSVGGQSSGSVSGTIGSGGTNFFSWEDKDTRDMVTITVIKDDRKNATSARLRPPAFIGKQGVVYREPIKAVKTGGPFITTEIKWTNRPANGTAFIKRQGETIKLEFNDKDSVSHPLSNIIENEPIEINFKAGEKGLNSVDFDCLIRGATPDSVEYYINYETPKA